MKTEKPTYEPVAGITISDACRNAVEHARLCSTIITFQCNDITMDVSQGCSPVGVEVKYWLMCHGVIKKKEESKKTPECIVFDDGYNQVEIERMSGGLSLFSRFCDEEIFITKEKAIPFAKALLKYCEENFSEE